MASPTGTIAPGAIPTLTSAPPQENAVASTTPSTEQPLVVAFAKDGDIHLWASETNQSRTIVKAGDVTTVMMSDDGQVTAFLRRSLVEQPELMEYVALWAVDRNGENPRELVSAESLRQRLNPDTRDSAGFAQLGWIPHTHRLVYSGSKHYLPGQGFTLSKDIYVVDADTLADTVLAEDIMPDTFINAWRFVLSPDGQQIALFTSTELSFINIDGSNWRKAVLTYPSVGVGDSVLLPNGVWTQDSRAFIFTGSMQSDSRFVLNYTIWRVPLEGSPAQPLATITDSHSSSVTFSPDGERMAFLQDIYSDRQIDAKNYRIMPLATDAGPLAIPSGLELFYANLHWSPGGAAFVLNDKDLLQLCPDAADSSDVCGDPIHLGSGSNIITSIQWIDSARFLFAGTEPATLALGSLDGTLTPIVAWAEGESGSWSFSTAR
jgi:WD40 repeat protein